jgi:hypothetical protein
MAQEDPVLKFICPLCGASWGEQCPIQIGPNPTLSAGSSHMMGYSLASRRATRSRSRTNNGRRENGRLPSFPVAEVILGPESKVVPRR